MSVDPRSAATAAHGAASAEVPAADGRVRPLPSVAAPAPTILAISTSSELEQVAWQTYDGKRFALRKQWRRGTPRRLLASIAAVVGSEALTAAQRIAVDVGPGSFTGVRLGLATARALAWHLDVEAVGVASTLLIAAAARRRGLIGPLRLLISSRAGHAYVSDVEAGAADAAPGATAECALRDLDAGPLGATWLAPALIAAWLRDGPAASAAVRVVDGPDVAELLDVAAGAAGAPWHTLLPHYIGVSEAERSDRGGAAVADLPVEVG